MAKLRPLRPNQHKAIVDLGKEFDLGFTRIMLQAPCGFGKTLTSAHIINHIINKNERVCFVVPRLTLLDQTIAAFAAEGFGDDIGVIQGNHPSCNYKKPLQIASLQTLTRRKLPEIDYMIVDEAHMTSKAFKKILKDNPGIKVIGLSATPWSDGLGKHYERLIIAGTTSDLIKDGLLTPFKIFAPTQVDLDNVRTVSGDFHQGDLSAAVNKKPIIGDLIKHYVAHAEKRPAICFCVDRAHAKHVQELFIEAGIPTAYVDCFTQDLDRREIIEDFRSGKIKVICNVGVLTTGFDAPEASCMIDAAPTKSLILHVQKTGRVLRTAPGKQDAIILDHAGNTLRLGIVTQINRDYLCDGSEASRKKRKDAEKSEPKPRLCEECKTVMARHLTECPECGTPVHKFTSVVHSNGQLKAVGFDAKTAVVPENRAQFFAELQYYGMQKGYKPGWAAVKFKEKHGGWPSTFGLYNVPPKPPSLSTINYIKSGQIAWAKSRQKYGMGA